MARNPVEAFAFIDIETTGLDPEKDFILEIAWAITDTSFTVLRSYRAVVDQQANLDGVFERVNASEYVRNMHENSGLLEDVKNGSIGSSLDELYKCFIEDLESITIGEHESITPNSIAIAGLSVGFDVSFLKADNWGALWEQGGPLSHRVLDLSSVKILLDANGIPWQQAPNNDAHRAMSDVLESIEQAKLFSALLELVK